SGLPAPVGGPRPRPATGGCAGRTQRVDRCGHFLHALDHGAGWPRNRRRQRPLQPRRQEGGMKENILDVLPYLFEHFVYDDPDSLNDRDSLQASLLEAGFSPSEISKAFDWLDVLARERPQLRPPSGGGQAPVRVFAAEEVAKL